MNNEYCKFLPLGTVVLLKGGKKKLMITGYCMVSKKNEEPVVYDYCGCPYPEGLIKTDKLGLFNHDQIEKVFYLGARDQEQVDFMKKLNDFIKLQKAFASRNTDVSDTNSTIVPANNVNSKVETVQQVNNV